MLVVAERLGLAAPGAHNAYIMCHLIEVGAIRFGSSKASSGELLLRDFYTGDLYILPAGSGRGDVQMITERIIDEEEDAEDE